MELDLISNKQAKPLLERTGNNMEEYERRLDLLFEVGEEIGSVSEMSGVLNQILGMAQRTLQAAASSVFLLNRETGELYLQITRGEGETTQEHTRFSLDAGIAGWVISHARPAISNDVAGDPRFDKRIDRVPGFITRSIMAVPLITGRKVIGVLELINKRDGSGFSRQDLKVIVSAASTAALVIENTRLTQAVQDTYKSTVKALAATIDARDPYTHGHSQRVMGYALLGGTELSLSRDNLENIEYAAILHDIGKIGIPDSILTKPGALTPEEWAIIHGHPRIGANMLKGIPFLKKARKIVFHHHERYDGRGYPDRLKGEDIPMEARLIAVADAFDTMTTDRLYRAAISQEKALMVLKSYAGSQFCPVAVKAFCSGLAKAHFPTQDLTPSHMPKNAAAVSRDRAQLSPVPS